MNTSDRPAASSASSLAPGALVAREAAHGDPVLGSLARLAFSLLGPAPSLGAAKDSLREIALRDPVDALFATVLGGSYLFYLAEKDDNPGVNTIWDALVIVSTSLSVGNSNVFPVTSAGKAIVAAVMTVGPSLSTRMLEPTAAERAAEETRAHESLALQRAMVARLDALLARGA